jgi:glycosyltransferase involved in cell wall biosynthesis
MRSITKKENTVLFLSRLAPDKKVELVIELAKKHLNYTFYIVGSLEQQNEQYIANIRNEIKDKKLSNVEIFVNQPYSNILNYLTISEYYVFFAENEHFGITTVEAILFNCIPFVHNSGGQKEIVKESMLKFDNDEMYNKFDKVVTLNHEDKTKLVQSLKSDITDFKEEVFINKMLSYIINI